MAAQNMHDWRRTWALCSMLGSKHSGAEQADAMAENGGEGVCEATFVKYADEENKFSPPLLEQVQNLENNQTNLWTKKDLLNVMKRIKHLRSVPDQRLHK